MHTNNTKEIIYKELSYELGGLFFKVQNELGRYARERHYADLFEKLLKEKGLEYEREKVVSKTGGDVNKTDFIIKKLLLVEFKAKPFTTKDDYYQVLRYLEFTNLRLGVIVNFRQKYLKPKRVINSKFH